VRGKWLLIGGSVVVLALGGAAVTVLLRQKAAAPAGTAGVQAAASFSGPVISLPGRIEAVEVVAVPVPVSGRIESLPVNVGAEVAEGDLLATIRSAELESQKEVANEELSRLQNRVSTLESALIAARLEASRARESAGDARASMDGAQKALQRQELLYSKGAAAKQAVEKSQAALNAAAGSYEGRQKLVQLADGRVTELNRELEEQQKALDDKNKEHEAVAAQVVSGDVRSPVDGYVVARRGAVGEEIALEVEDLFLIAVNLTDLRAVVNAPPSLLEKVRAGQEAILQIAELPDGVPTKVTEVRDGQVIMDFTSPNTQIKPGITVQVVIKLN
jgi:multidrug efflux pump subunit AcrA (membrane-fusion protein)